MNDYAEHNLVNQLYFNKKIVIKKNKILRTFLKLLKKKKSLCSWSIHSSASERQIRQVRIKQKSAERH